MSYTNQITLFRKRAGMSQTELAEKIGTSLSMLGKLERGERTLNHDWLVKLANALGATPAQLIDTQPSGHFTPYDDEDEDEPELVRVQELDLAYGMGGGTYLDLPVKSQKQVFTSDWLRNFTQAPAEKIFIARGAGDSMMPTILDADIVVIDTTDNQVKTGDKIWAVAYGETGMIKRLRPMPDGSVKILSDNPSVPPEVAYDGELSVVGRVVAIVRKT